MWRCNSHRLVCESSVLFLQHNLMLHIVLTHSGKSFCLSDEPINSLNSREIHIALSFPCFITIITIPAQMDEQLAHFSCVHCKVLSVLLKHYLSNSALLWDMRCNLGNSSCQKHQNQRSSPHFSWWQRHRCWNTSIFTSNIYHVLECLSLQNT